MITNSNTASVAMDEEAAIILPATALAPFAEPFGNRFGGGHNAALNGSSSIAAAATQSEPFPCSKKSAWSEEALVKVVPVKGAPDR